ncbi:MAG: winged helix DNA-binding protein [Ancalomicrobiaceae bacterium]|nr:winged helix DNA-binding protein [Ancalomicrobiaceae bacterium]
MTPKKDTKPKSTSKALDRSWHLSRSPGELDLTETEFALMRAYEGFGRWQAECLAAVVDFAATGPENALLHIIRMNDRPKTIKDLAHLTNRTDIPNIQYSLRKLIKAGLVERQGSGRAGVTYSVTPAGWKVTEDYADVRDALLLEAIRSVPDFSERLSQATHSLELLTGIYEQVARVAATHRRSSR